MVEQDAVNPETDRLKGCRPVSAITGPGRIRNHSSASDQRAEPVGFEAQAFDDTSSSNVFRKPMSFMTNWLRLICPKMRGWYSGKRSPDYCGANNSTIMI